MSKKLTDIFNAVPPANAETVQRLQTVLDLLPAKVQSLAAQNPAMDILMVQIPVDAAADRTVMQKIAFAFERKLSEEQPNINCHLSLSSSIWGDAMMITFVVGEEHPLTTLRHAGKNPTKPESFFAAYERIKTREEITAYFGQRQAFDAIQHMMHRTRAEGGDPDAIGPVTFDGMQMFGVMLAPEKYHGRYQFWPVDDAWPKPEILPQFRAQFGKGQNPKPPGQ